MSRPPNGIAPRLDSRSRSDGGAPPNESAAIRTPPQTTRTVDPENPDRRSFSFMTRGESRHAGELPRGQLSRIAGYGLESGPTVADRMCVSFLSVPGEAVKFFT